MFRMLHKTRLFSKKLQGFSIAEAILAAFVLTTGLIAVMALIANSLKNSFETRDTIIAVELAQEGIELVRNVRDNDFIAGNDGFSRFPSSKQYCRIDYKVNVNSNLDCSASNYSLQYNNGFYEHGGSGGRFSRRLYIDYDATNKEALVRSFVYWGGIFTPPGDGSATNCTASKKCVFTEIRLKSWKN